MSTTVHNWNTLDVHHLLKQHLIALLRLNWIDVKDEHDNLFTSGMHDENHTFAMHLNTDTASIVDF